MPTYQFTAYPGICHTRPVLQCAQVRMFKKLRQCTQVRLCHPLITSTKYRLHTVEQLIPQYAVPRRLSASTQLSYAAPWSWPLHPVRLNAATLPFGQHSSARLAVLIRSCAHFSTSILQYFGSLAVVTAQHRCQSFQLPPHHRRPCRPCTCNPSKASSFSMCLQPSVSNRRQVQWQHVSGRTLHACLQCCAWMTG